MTRLVLAHELAQIVSRSGILHAAALVDALQASDLAVSIERIQPKELLPTYRIRWEMAVKAQAPWKDDIAHFVKSSKLIAILKCSRSATTEPLGSA